MFAYNLANIQSLDLQYEYALHNHQPVCQLWLKFNLIIKVLLYEGNLED